MAEDDDDRPDTTPTGEAPGEDKATDRTDPIDPGDRSEP